MSGREHSSAPSSVRLLELGDALHCLLRQFTREEALWHLLPVAKACGRLLQDFEAAEAGSSASSPSSPSSPDAASPWRPRTPPSELAKTLRRLQFWYGRFNGGRELRCMQLFTRLLHELRAEGVVEWVEQPPPQPARPRYRSLSDTCVWGFSSLSVLDRDAFAARCREMVLAHACMRDAELRCVWFHFDPEWIASKMLRCNGFHPVTSRAYVGPRPLLAYDHWVFGRHMDWLHEQHKRQLRGPQD
jgi:hypothetical protein